MGTRETVGSRQPVGAVTQQAHIRMAAAIVGKVPRAIDIRDLLQCPDGERAKQQPSDQKNRRPPQGYETRSEQARCQYADRRESRQAHEQAAARVDEIDGPPALLTEPHPG